MSNLSSPNSYIKKISVELMSYSCVFKNVETKQMRKLNFYEKAIILLLSRGVKADDIDSLIQKISQFLNIRESFVKEFIMLLNGLESLHDGGNVFSLSSSVKVEKYKKDERLLVSNVCATNDDFNFLYISQLDTVTSSEVPGLEKVDEEAILITENYISPLANLIAPHLKKLEEVAQSNLPNDLAMFFSQEYLLEQLNTTESYAQKSKYYADVEYVYDDFKKQGNISSVIKLINSASDDYWQYFNDSLRKHIMNTFVVDYEEPLFIKAKIALDSVSSNQRVLLSHNKDYMTNEKAIEKLNEKISILEEEMEDNSKVTKEMEKNIATLKKSDDQKNLIKEQQNYNKKLIETSRKQSTKNKLLEEKKQIETENIIIGHKIEDSCKIIIKDFKTNEFAKNKAYFSRIDDLYQSIMKLPCLEIRAIIDSMVRTTLMLLQQVDDRCEEGVKVSFKNLKPFVNLANYILEYVYKVEDKQAVNLLYEKPDKIKKACPNYTMDIHNNLIKLLPLLSVLKNKNNTEKINFEDAKKAATKDFFEDNINNAKYRKDIVFAFVEFVLSLDFKQSDWSVIEEKLK